MAVLEIAQWGLHLLVSSYFVCRWVRHRYIEWNYRRKGVSVEVVATALALKEADYRSLKERNLIEEKALYLFRD